MSKYRLAKYCPVCKKKKIISSFLDRHNIRYNTCLNCKSIYQKAISIKQQQTNYENFIIDPDGEKRFLKNEQKEKLKNWYGETINFINNQNQPGKILDYGSGLGFFLNGINKKWQKYAFEISPTALTFLKKKTNYKVFDNIASLKKKSNFFDVIFFYHVIEHLEKPYESLKVIKKLLKKNGILIIGTPNINCIAYKIFRKNFRLLGPGHIFLLNDYSLKKLLSKFGFKVLKMEYPFFKTKYFNLINLFRLFMPWKISPPFYKSIMTCYAKKN